MARSLTPTEFYTELGKRTETSPEKMQEIWEIFIDFLLEELKVYNIVSLPLFATVENLKRGDCYKVMPTSKEEQLTNGGELTKLTYIPEKRRLTIRPTDGFKEQLNDEKITRYERNKQKQIINKQRTVEENLAKQKELEDKARLRFEKVMQKKIEKEKQRKENAKKSQRQLEKEKHWIDYGSQ